MAESSARSTGPADATRELPRGESQWSLIVREFRKRRLAIVCLWVISGLVAVSVLAPFLANDRPLLYRGFNRFEYAEAARNVRSLLGSFSANPLETAALIAMQLDLMSAQVDRETAAALQAFGRDVESLAGAHDPAELPQAVAGLRAQLREEFDSRRVTLVSRWHSPVAESLRPRDLAFLSLLFVALTSPLWRRVLRHRLGRNHPAIGRIVLGATVLVPLCAAGLWWLTVPERVDRTRYKDGALSSQGAEAVASATVVYEQVVWPPVAFALDEQDLDAKFEPPAWWPGRGRERAPAVGTRSNGLPAEMPHWLGADSIGRDILCRMIWGGRISLAVGIVAVSIYVSIGVVVGAVAGYFRGLVDTLVSRLIEVVICFPSFFLILTIVAFVGPSIFNIMVVIGVTGWTGVARLVRGEFLRLGEQDFVLAGRGLGYSAPRIIFRHILPNALAPVLVSATFGIAGAILTESGLSFLGFGITIPTPSWGGILASGREAMFSAPWLIYFPGFAIFVTITCYNLVGEAFRDAADPRLRDGGRA